MSSQDSGAFTERIMSKFKLVTVSEHEPWLAQALSRFERVEWVDLSKVVDDYALSHWADFLHTLPEREIRYSVPDLIDEVGLWDRKLAREKLIGSLNDGTELLVELPAAEGHDLMLVKLLTEEAYHNEGSVMHHCVGKAGYFHKHGVQIWSLRSPQSEAPLATIEIATTYNNRLCVKQIKAKSNQTPAVWILNALKAYFDANSIHEFSGYDETDAPLDYDTEYAQAWTGPTPVRRVRRTVAADLVSRPTPEVEIDSEGLAKQSKSLKRRIPL